MNTIRLSCVGIGLALALLSPARLEAVDSPTQLVVSPPAEGDWLEASSWSSGVPSSSVAAIVDNGGTANILGTARAKDIFLGTTAAGSGRLEQSAGNLVVADYFDIGQYGDGSFTLSGGVAIVNREVRVAPNHGATGMLTVSDGYFQPGYLFVGQRVLPRNAIGSARAVQTGGIIEIFYAGLSLEGPDAVYELKGGTLRALDQVITGDDGSARFIQTGGLNDARSSSGGGYGQGLVRVGIEGTDQAVYELHGGELMSTSTVVGAYRGQGLFTQTGGEHHVFSAAGIASEMMSQGVYELSGGVFIVDQTLTIGTGGPGELSMIGPEATFRVGNLTVASQGTVEFTVTGGGVTKAEVSGKTDFLGRLRVSDSGARRGVYPLLEVSASSNFNPLAIELPGPEWSWQRSGNLFSVTKIPEPSAIQLVCLATMVAVQMFARRSGE